MVYAYAIPYILHSSIMKQIIIFFLNYLGMTRKTQAKSLIFSHISVKNHYFLY